MKHCNKRPFHATSFTFVPVCSHQPGKGRHDACLTPASSAAFVSLNRAHMSLLGQLAGDRRNWELSAFSFCLGKTKGRLRSGSSLPVSLRQLQFHMLGRGRVLWGSRDTADEAQSLCKELDRSRRLGPAAEGWARCLLSKPHPGAERLSLTCATEGRAFYPLHVPVHDKALAPVSDTVLKATQDPYLF